MNVPVELTDIEARRLTLFARGLTERDVAKEEEVSLSAIKQSMSNIREKLWAKTTIQAVAMGVMDSICSIISVTTDIDKINLDDRQKECLDCLGQGMLQKQADAFLDMPIHEFKKRKSQIIKMMWALNINHAIAIYMLLNSRDE